MIYSLIASHQNWKCDYGYNWTEQIVKNIKNKLILKAINVGLFSYQPHLEINRGEHYNFLNVFWIRYQKYDVNLEKISYLILHKILLLFGNILQKIFVTNYGPTDEVSSFQPGALIKWGYHALSDCQKKGFRRYLRSTGWG